MLCVPFLWMSYYWHKLIQRIVDVPKNLIAGKRKVLSLCNLPKMELFFQEGILGSSNNCSYYLEKHTGGKTVMGHWWARPHLVQNHLVMCSSCLLFKCRPHVSTLKEGGPGRLWFFFLFLFTIGSHTINVYLLFSYTTFLGYWAQVANLVCLGYKVPDSDCNNSSNGSQNWYLSVPL